MAEIATNRDLYRFIAALLKQPEEGRLSLRQYLENLRQLGDQLRGHDAIPMQAFADLLRAAFEPGLCAAESGASASDGYLAWKRRITEQIRDLGEMQEAGTLDNEYRSFGMDAPRGGRWFNFDPCTYLECAVAGTFGGWQEGDATGRSYVSGPVAILDPTGAITALDPRNIDEPVVEVPRISWKMFVDFLNAGQWYE